VTYSGFNIGGVDWPRPELAGLDDPTERGRALRALTAGEAEMVAGLGGNMIRVFYAVDSVIEGDRTEIATALGSSVPGPGTGQGIYLRTVEERAEALDRAADVLDRLLTVLDGRAAPGLRLDFSMFDAIVGGVADFNGRGAPQPVRLLLTLVAPAPRWLVEAPSSDTLRESGRSFDFDSLWAMYLQVHVELHRQLIGRYLADRRSRRSVPAVAAFEIGNEPDYIWVPEEVKIEGAAERLVYPLGKYVTELHLPQVPHHVDPAPAFQVEPWGYGDQDAEWKVRATPRRVPIVDFDWGAKFDWYVRCFCELQERLADTIHEASAGVGVPVDIVSGSVTHNNIDYLMRMARVNPRAFASVTKIGIHPYHWRDNNVWDARFVDPDTPMDEWCAATAREFAGEYFKRFDFLEEIARCVRPAEARGPERPADAHTQELAAALAGKKLWITEFGIGTKALGAFNSPVAELTRFIRSRAAFGLAGGHGAAVWEDLWDALVHQATAAYLREHEVECLLLYSLREAGLPQLDMDDDDRSNLAILHRDGTPRMDDTTLTGVRNLLSDLAGSPAERPAARRWWRRRRPTPAPIAAPTAVEPRPGLEMHRRPWRELPLPPGPAGVETMLSTEERQLLLWLTRDWYSGAGAIVDGGCFVGGSTLALAEGLRSNERLGPDRRIDVFDLFEVEPYMADTYFAERGLKAGESFRSLFDENTADVADLLVVHAGDFAATGWDGGDIEVLFIDLAKSWDLNDRVVQTFFPRLIADRSVVVQQDYAFAFCPWVALTMELLTDYFEPVAFVEYNSVAYVSRRPVPEGVFDTPLAALPLTRKIELIDGAIARFRGYPRAYLEHGRALLLAEGGDLEAARTALAAAQHAHDGDEVAAQSAALVQSFLGVSAG
jgi:hypothetical protein